MMIRTLVRNGHSISCTTTLRISIFSQNIFLCKSASNFITPSLSQEIKIIFGFLLNDRF